MRSRNILPWLRKCLLLLFVIFCAEQNSYGQALAAKDVDVGELTREIVRNDAANGKLTFFLWMPEQFWQASMAQRQSPPSPEGNELFSSLAQYTVVAIAVGKRSGIAEYQFLTEDELRSVVFLRDANGKDYSAVATPSTSAQIVAGVFKPILAKIAGNFGQHTELMFFPAKTQDGRPVADPISRGSFSIVVKDTAGGSERVFQYHLPLTSLLVPKFCPVGGERVQADWNYCPWHGVSLTSSPPPAVAKPAKQ